MVSLDTVFDLLSDERRRYTLYYLKEQEGPVSIDELVEVIVDWETDSTVEAAPAETVDRVELSLEHVHLPRTAEVEFIEYVPEEEIVRIQGAPPKFDTIVTIAKLIEQPAND